MGKSSRKTRRTKVRDNEPIKAGRRREWVHVRGELTRCPRCHSTDRTGYCHVRVLASTGTAPDGHPYTHIVWRRTQCTTCGQHRIDRFFENRASE